MGVAVYRILRAPFAAIAESATARFGSRLLTRAMAVCMTVAAVVGFLSVSYTEKSCRGYEQVVKDREYLMQINQQQVARTSDWLVRAVFLWCIVVLLCLLAWHRNAKRQEGTHD
jgi:hypothetical protein